MHPFLTRDAATFGKSVCRLGLASRGASELAPDDVLAAIERGVNFINWPAGSEGPPEADAFSRAISALGRQREQAVVCIQLAARTADEATAELSASLALLATDYVDVVTLYYVEQLAEWQELIAPGGALDYCRRAQANGVIRRLGLTSHQRSLAAMAAASGLVDVVMIRYNAAHRGAERETFPVTDQNQVGVIAYTALRWGALLQATPDDPPGWTAPGAASWYRFVLENDSVDVVLAAPRDRDELAQDLQVLEATGRLSASEYESLAQHGQRVRRHAGSFP